MMSVARRALCGLAVTTLVSAVPGAWGQKLAAVAKLPVQQPVAAAPVSAVTGPIDENKRTVIPGNVRPEALNAANDRGPLAGNHALEHIMLLLHRTPAKQAAFDAYVDSLSDQSSPNYHKWLTAQQIGSQYGPSQADLTTVSDWLTSRGFTVNRVYETGTMIDFSGSSALVENAFHTSMHKLSVDGEEHISNVTDLEIPSALTGVVQGVVSLDDFRPHPMHKNISRAHIDPHTHQPTVAGQSERVATTTAVGQPKYTTSDGSYQLVTPGDLSQIYRLFKLFNHGISGQGQTVVVIEDTDLYASSDVTTFINTFGLNQYNGSFATVHPGSCTDPGVVTGNDGEATLDVEYALAAAPSSTVQLASCKDTTTFGGLIALQNMINSTTTPVPKIVSISYGESESLNGSTRNAAYYNTYQSGAAMGMSIFVSSGDEGAASSDANLSNATHGITVSGFASTPYNVAVGGTDFADSYFGTNAQYWSATNSATGQSALSYIPEIPWNDSCASTLLASAYGFNATYGSSGFCNDPSYGEKYYLTTGSGSGGPSNCATGTATTRGVYSGTCAGWPKPSWQTGLGTKADGVRDIPDVSLFAANGVWGHYYPYCYTHTAGGGASCSGTPDTWAGAGGTSFASPILAAMQALVNQATGSYWGNPNPVYYALANAQYGTTGGPSCNTQTGDAAGLSCVFHDITLGDIDVNCTGTHNCYIPSGSYGVLSTSNSSYLPAYSSNVGWDFATGLGSVSAQGLVNSFITYAHSSVTPIIK